MLSMQDARVGCADSQTTTAADVRQADLEIGMGCFGVTTTCRRQEMGQDQQPAAGCLPARSKASQPASQRQSGHGRVTGHLAGGFQAGWKLLCTHPAAERRRQQYTATTVLAGTIHSCCSLFSAAFCCIYHRKPLPACVSNPRHRPFFSDHARQRLTSGHLHFPPPIGASARHTNLRHLTATDDNLRPPATTHIQPWTPCATSPHHCLALAAATSSLTSCCPTSRPLPSLSQISTRLPPPRMLAREKQATRMPWMTYWLSWTRRTWA